MNTILVAHDKNKVIGKNNDIPWHLPEDMKLFKERTTNHCCIMGRKTWESLPDRFRPLPNRINIVVSSLYDQEPDGFVKTLTNPSYHEDGLTGAWSVPTMEDAVALAGQMRPDQETFVIGGAQIYEAAITKNLTDKIILSMVHGTHEGDTFFPELGPEWSLQEVENNLGFDVHTLTRS